MKYSRVLSAFYGAIWAVRREKLEEMQVFLQQHALDGVFRGLTTADLYAAQESAAAAAERSKKFSTGSIAVLPLFGSIMNRANIMSEFSGGTSLDRFRGQFRDALNDPSVKGIVLDVDSPGGVVDGVPEMADEIFQARGKKQISAIANTMAASAGYWLAAAAGELFASPSADVGSIGVYALHFDFSKQAEMEGVKPTFISAGKFKTEGNELEPLGDEAAAAIQSRVDEFYDMFIRDVARFRGVAQKTVREGFGQGRVVGAAQAEKEGMIDRVATFDQAIERVAGRMARQKAARATAALAEQARIATLLS